MIGRFDIFFLLLFASVALPWGIMIYKAEEQLMALEPVSAQVEGYFEDSAGNAFDTPEEYIAYVKKAGGDVAKAKRDIAYAQNEWDTNSSNLLNSQAGLMKTQRNIEGEPVFPLIRGGSALRGKRIYEANGCVQCHTQQVRQEHIGVDIPKYGKRHSVPRDYIHDSPVLTGYMRIGPDLANVGDRLDKVTLHKHIYRPSSSSSMPSYKYLYNVRKIRGGISETALHFEADEYGAPEPGYEVIPKEGAIDLVNYLASLTQHYELPEAKFVKDKNAHAGDHADETPGGAGSNIFAKGKKLYNTPGACVTCHQANGLGLAAANFPPLANSEWVTGSEEVIVRIVLNGVQGPMKVGDKEYGAVPMVPTLWASWSDDDIAAVISYVRNEWGNEAPLVTPETVKRIRAEVGTRNPWTAQELEAYKN